MLTRTPTCCPKRRIDDEMKKALLLKKKRKERAEKAAAARWVKPDAPSIAPSMAVAAWHQKGVAVIDPADIPNEFERQRITNIANQLYGKRAPE